MSADGFIGSVERPIPHTSGLDVSFERKLYTCDECGAVVVELTREKHAAWHRQMSPPPGPLAQDIASGKLKLEFGRSE